MNLRDIVTLFKNHQIQYGLNGDSNLEELYKWELVSKQNGHPDPNAVDFSKEINSLEFKNLCFSSQITAIRNFAKYEPEEYSLNNSYRSKTVPLFYIKLNFG